MLQRNIRKGRSCARSRTVKVSLWQRVTQSVEQKHSFSLLPLSLLSAQKSIHSMHLLRQRKVKWRHKLPRAIVPRNIAIDDMYGYNDANGSNKETRWQHVLLASLWSKYRRIKNEERVEYHRTPPKLTARRELHDNACVQAVTGTAQSGAHVHRSHTQRHKNHDEECNII